MKLMIDERVKHRVIGLAVILSIGAIFAPAIMKKSNQRLDGNVSVSVELPAKPLHPDIVMAEKSAMFATAKVAHVELPEASKEEIPPSTIAKAEPLSPPNKNELSTKLVEQVSESISHDTAQLVKKEPQELPVVVKTTNVAVVEKIAHADFFPPEPKVVVKVKSLPKITKLTKEVVKRVPKTPIKNGYAVQLATFTQLKNAAQLISKLKQKGYSATYNKVKTNEGMVYKVLVGQVNKREQAEVLQKQLASSVQMRGFVVATGQG